MPQNSQNTAPPKVGGQYGNTRALRNGLRSEKVKAGIVLGKLGKQLGYVAALSKVFAKSLERSVLAAGGDLDVMTVCGIDTAAKWQRHGLLVQRWLRLENANMNHDQRLAYSREIARAATERDRAVRSLGIERPKSTVLDALYVPAAGGNGYVDPEASSVDAGASGVDAAADGDSSTDCVRETAAVDLEEDAGPTSEFSNTGAGNPKSSGDPAAAPEDPGADAVPEAAASPVARPEAVGDAEDIEGAAARETPREKHTADCPDCGGTRSSRQVFRDLGTETLSTCPTCADWREHNRRDRGRQL